MTMNANLCYFLSDRALHIGGPAQKIGVGGQYSRLAARGGGGGFSGVHRARFASKVNSIIMCLNFG